MRAATGTKSSASLGTAQFAATRWSVVLAARASADHAGKDALETLCRLYWPPLYSYVRRQGYAPHDAQDLTQGFFARLLAHEYLNGVDRSKGRFRSFLLAAMKHFLANEWRNAHCQKRGGNSLHLSIDDDELEQFHAHAANLSISPENLFERQWATALLDQVLARLQSEFLVGGKQILFDRLKVFLTGDCRRGGGAYAAVASELGVTEAAVKMSVCRLRRRYGQILREEIARTVSSDEEVEIELKALFAALNG